ncbi:MAG: Ig-like domain-containing protein, partial [Duncaniella sp.]|nr:Ig-like domain-containing protein [Duncaniella sp.]
ITADINGELVEVPAYTLTLNVGTPGAGSVSCVPGGSEFDEGTQLTVSATENFGFHFESWTDDSGAVVSTANPYTFEIKENTTLTANYSQTPVYALNVAVEGGANSYLVQFMPEGNVVDGVHYYEEGTDVSLTAVNNRIITFTNWEDNSTSAERIIKMDSEKNVTATFSAADYIVGWDFYYDQPNKDRAADYKAESDNAGLLSLRNAEGATSTWLTRGVSNGAENGKWGARIWRLRSDGYYFEISFSTAGYSNIKVAASLGVSYNTYSTFHAQWSADGNNFADFGTYTLAPGWTTNEFELPAEAAGQSRVWVRYMPDTSSPLVGAATDYDGLCIADVYVLADLDAADDDVAPEVVSIIPADGFEGASATGSVIVTFNEKIVAGSGNATLNGETLNMTVSGKTAVFPYAGLEYATTYTFSLPAGAVTDRSGNPAPAVKSTFTTLERTQPEARLFDAIVAADGSGDYTSVQDAIDAAPEGRVKPWLIFVKNGNYKEHVDIPKTKPMMHIIGQDRDKAVILDDKLCGGDNALHVSVGATVVVNANDCFFENITLENSYGHEKQAGPQALALNTTGDRTIFNNVAMLSYQDTWITPSTSAYRAYVRNSFIEGAVDFIYNSGDIYIDNTILYINRKSGGFIVAPSHDVDVKWGYVFNNCTITAPGVPSETDVWLGRPWHNFPKTVFLNTRAEVTIPAAGWYETMGGLPAIWADWNTVDGNGNPVDLSQRRDTYWYTDSSTGEKVYGTAKNHLTDEEAAEYTIKNVLSGSDNWQPVIKTESCDAPAPILVDGVITWEEVPYAICYLVTKGDEVVGFTTEPKMELTLTRGADDSVYSVQAVNEFGGLSAKGSTDKSSGVGAVVAETETEVIGIYDLQGRALHSPVKGLNIIMKRTADGKIFAEKVLIR